MTPAPPPARGGRDGADALERARLSARIAHRDTTRLIRLLSEISGPSTSHRLVDGVLALLSELFGSDVTLLVATDGRVGLPVRACGLPDDAPPSPGWPLSAELVRSLGEGRPVTVPCPAELTTVHPPGLATRRPVLTWVPLSREGETVHALALVRWSGVPLPCQDLDILRSFAMRLAAVMAARRHERALEQLVRVGERLSLRLAPEALLDEAAGLLQTLAEADAAWVVVPSAGVGEVVARRGEPGPADRAVPPTDLPGWADVRTGGVWAGSAPSGGGTDGCLLAVAVPGDESGPEQPGAGPVRAVLVARRAAPHVFVRTEVEAARVLADGVAAALANLRLHDTVRAQEASFRLIADSISDLVCVVDEEGCVTYASPSYERQLGMAPAALVGRPLVEQVHPEDRGRVGALLRGDGPARAEFRARTAWGQWVWAEGAARRLAADDASQVVSTRVVSDRKQLEDELRRRATRDHLTGLANRAAVTERLEAALRGRRPGDATGHVGLLFCDVDRFKSVNDRLGHAAGDQLLVQVARRMRSAVRDGDVLARFGGDEFVVLLPDVDGLAGVEEVGRRVLAAMSEPFVLLGEPVHASVSVGGVAGRPGVTDAGALLRDADAAMYGAKDSGRDRLIVHDEVAASRSLDRLDLRSDLASALDRGQLGVEYQPIVDLTTGRAVGVEALLRWHHPVRGAVPPDEFIPMAEESGVVREIGGWVLATATARLARWRDELGLPDLALHVNVSPVELEDPRFVRRVVEALARHRIEPGTLWLEVVERGDVRDRAVEAVRRLRALGVRVTLDDFGVSSSNLDLLRRLEPDGIKIDRSFVAGVTSGTPLDLAVVRAIGSIAASLRVQLIAEGIERPDQVPALQDLGCTLGQGHLLGRPGPAHVVREVLTAGSGEVSGR